MKKIIISLFFIAMCSTLFSFMNIENGFNDLSKVVRGTYALVPAGKVYFDNNSAVVNAFYILKYEVDNLSYREFIADLKKSGRTEDLKVAQIDSAGWRNQMSYNEPYVNYYHIHSAYDHYPVVNISYEGATLYCNWLTEKLNQQYSHEFSYEVRLPTRTEWLRAANYDNGNSSYSWKGSSVRNEKGIYLCNFKNIGEEKIHFDNESSEYKILKTGSANSLNDISDITAPVKSYFPNALGIYNMNGNVAEMISEKGIAVGGSWNSTGYDVRNESTMNYKSSSPLIGFRPIMIIKKK